jgi:hypothetical protein
MVFRLAFHSQAAAQMQTPAAAQVSHPTAVQLPTPVAVRVQPPTAAQVQTSTAVEVQPPTTVQRRPVQPQPTHQQPANSLSTAANKEFSSSGVDSQSAVDLGRAGGKKSAPILKVLGGSLEPKAVISSKDLWSRSAHSAHYRWQWLFWLLAAAAALVAYQTGRRRRLHRRRSAPQGNSTLGQGPDGRRRAYRAGAD